MEKFKGALNYSLKSLGVVGGRGASRVYGGHDSRPVKDFANVI